MTGFQTIVMVDWSARSAPSPAKPTKDSIFIGVARDGKTGTSYHRTRTEAVAALCELFDAELKAKRRVLAGFDFPFGYPRGFARAVTGSDDPLVLWQWLAGKVSDGPTNENNRWEVAEELNALFPGIGPFWGCPSARTSGTLPAKGSVRHGHGMEERRAVEKQLPRAQACWKLFTTGSVGSQVLMGLPHLNALRQKYGAMVSVSPFQQPDTPIVLAEIYPGLIDATIKAKVNDDEVLDAGQVRLMAQAFAKLPPHHLNTMLQEGDDEEGWILGLGHEAALIANI